MVAFKYKVELINFFPTKTIFRDNGGLDYRIQLKKVPAPMQFLIMFCFCFLDKWNS